jgi:hypothetical protein
MHGLCIMHITDETCTQNFSIGKSEEKRPLEILRHRREDIIKMYLKVKRYVGLDSSRSSQESVALLLCIG